MTQKDGKLPTSFGVSGESISLRLNAKVRPLSEDEIDSLAEALGKPVDRDFLASRLWRTISDVVRLSTQPTPREYRDRLLLIARDGRKWVNQIEVSAATISLRQYADLGTLTATVTEFCDRVDAAAKLVGASIKSGHPQTPFLLEVFLDNLIGIAKWAKVLPSTPSRAIAPKRPAPAFFRFVNKALVIARDVVESSPLPANQKRATVSIFRARRRGALIKIVERKRGPIKGYQDSLHGLIEWNSEPSKADGS
jgi:hypothetical protein